MGLFSRKDTPAGMRDHAAHLRKQGRLEDKLYGKGTGDHHRRDAQHWEGKARKAERRR